MAVLLRCIGVGGCVVKSGFVSLLAVVTSFLLGCGSSSSLPSAVTSASSTPSAQPTTPAPQPTTPATQPTTPATQPTTAPPSSSTTTGGTSPVAASAPPTYSVQALTLSASATDATQGVFTKYVYSFPLSAQATSAVGLSGSVSISGSGVGLSEALFSVGDAPSGACLPNGSQFTDYPTLYSAIPGATNLGTFIVKAFGNDTETINTNINWPAPLPISGCIFIILDGGPPSGGSVTMTSSMALDYTAQKGATVMKLVRAMSSAVARPRDANWLPLPRARPSRRQ